MGNRIIFIAVLSMMFFVIGCATPKISDGAQETAWQTIDAEGRFSFQLPQGMNRQEVQPIDSFGQQYAGDGMLVAFDYGWYSDPLNRLESQPEYWEKWQEIGGFNAKLIGYRLDSGSVSGPSYYAGVSFRNITHEGAQPIHFTMSISYNDSENRNTAIKILESIRFE